MTRAELVDFLAKEERKMQVLQEAHRAYTLLEFVAESLSTKLQEAGVSFASKGTALATIIFSKNPLIDVFPKDVQEEIRILYYTRCGPFLGIMPEMTQAMKEIEGDNG